MTTSGWCHRREKGRGKVEGSRYSDTSRVVSQEKKGRVKVEGLKFSDHVQVVSQERKVEG